MMPIQSSQTVAELLAQWQTRMATLSQALLTLEELPSYRALLGKSSPDFIEQGLLHSSYQLFEQFDQLVHVIEQAQQLHQDRQGLFSTFQQDKTALDLLQEASLQISQDLLSGPAPGLASSPAAGLAKGQEVLNTPGMSWWLQGSTTRLSRKLNPVPPLRLSPEQLLKHFMTQYQQTLDGLRRIEQHQVQEAREQASAIAQVRVLGQQLPQHYAIAQTIQANYRQKIALEPEAIACPSLPEKAQFLALALEWEQLSQHLGPTASVDDLAPVQRWRAAANRMMESLKTVQAWCQQQLDLRQELRGRFDAVQAKALARGRIEDSNLVALARQTEQLLYSRPTPLHRCLRCLRQYEQALNQARS